MAKTPFETVLDHVDSIDFERALDLLVTKYPCVTTFGFVNAHSVNLAVDDEQFYRALLDCSHLFRDGVGVELAMRVLKREPGANNNGTDLIVAALSEFSDRRMALVGSKDAVLEKASASLRNKYSINCIGTLNGFDYDSEHYLEFVKKIRPDVLILALGMPKQELLAQNIKQNYKGSLTIVCGGAILSFLTGEEPRAPEPLRKVKLEWFWRLMRDPLRLFPRYVTGGFKFGYRLAKVAVLTAEKV